MSLKRVHGFMKLAGDEWLRTPVSLLSVWFKSLTSTKVNVVNLACQIMLCFILEKLILFCLRGAMAERFDLYF